MLREIDPLGFVKAGIWDLGGQVQGQVRFFRVSRMLDIEALDRTLECPAGFDLALAWREWTDRSEQNLYPIEATVRSGQEGLTRAGILLAPIAARRVEESCGVPHPEGWREAGEPIESIENRVTDALRIGCGIQIPEPPELGSAVAVTVH